MNEEKNPREPQMENPLGMEPVSSLIVRFFRIYLFFIWLDALQPITSTFFTSIGKPAKGIFLSLTRQIIFFVPLLLILPRFFGVDGCIYTGPIADFMAAAVTIIMAFFEFRKMPKYAVQHENAV